MNKENRLISCLVLLMAMASCSSQVVNIQNGNENSAATTQPVAGSDASNTPTPTPERVQVNKEPRTLVETFYEFYLEDSRHPTMEGNERAFLNFLTVRFYDEAEKIEDYDPFFDVPEFAGAYKDLKISDAVISGNKATVDVEAKAPSATWIVRVSLVKKSGTWKIDGVKHDLKN